MLLLRAVSIEAVIQIFLEADTQYSTHHADYMHFIASSLAEILFSETTIKREHT